MSAAIVPVGSLRQRHIYGVNRLRESNPELDAYVIGGGDEQTKGPPFTIIRNAYQVADSLDAHRVPANPRNEIEVSRAFMVIYERLRARQKQPTIYVDITSTTKVVVRVTLVFAMLFGFRPYIVAAKQHYSNLERTREILKILFDPELPYLRSITAAMKDYRQKPDDTISRLVTLLEKKMSEIRYNLKADSQGVRVDLVLLPSVKPIVLADRDKLALIKLRDADKSGKFFETVKDLALALGLAKKSEQISLGYRIKKLRQWALIFPEQVLKPKRRKQRIGLTPVGSGIAEALKKRL